MEIQDRLMAGFSNHGDQWCQRLMSALVDTPREGRTFPSPLWIEEDEPAPLPGVPPERHGRRNKY